MIISSGLTFLQKGINNEYLLDDLTVFCAFGTSCMTFHFDLIDFWEQFYLSKTPCVKAIRLIDISSNRPYLLFLGNDLRRNFFTRKAKSWWQWPPFLLKKKKKRLSDGITNLAFTLPCLQTLWCLASKNENCKAIKYLFNFNAKQRDIAIAFIHKNHQKLRKENIYLWYFLGIYDAG